MNFDDFVIQVREDGMCHVMRNQITFQDWLDDHLRKEGVVCSVGSYVPRTRLTGSLRKYVQC